MAAAAAHLRRVSAAHARFNAFAHLAPAEQVLSQLRASSSSAPSPLGGRLVAVKANICVEGWPTTCASRALFNYRAPYDATCVTRLRDNGAVLVGSTNMDEFGMGNDGSTSAHGPTLNPWSASLSPGGSSSGSAAAVAARAVFAALGSDTGGSIRLPAARCGVVGLVPNRGVVSRHGLVAYASSLDTVGVIAQRVADAAKVMSCIAGPDGRDATCLASSSFHLMTPKAVTGPLRLGIPLDLLTHDLCASTLKAWQDSAGLLLDSGEATLVDVSLDGLLSHCLPAYYVVALAEASSNLARYDGVRYGSGSQVGKGLAFEQAVTAERSATLGPEVQRRLLLGALALSVDSSERFYKRASKFRDHLREKLWGLLDHQVDALLLPTAPTAAELTSNTASAGYAQDLFTVPSSLAGLASLSLPVAVCPSTNAPVGMQIVARDVATCVQVGVLLEKLVAFELPDFIGEDV